MLETNSGPPVKEDTMMPRQVPANFSGSTSFVLGFPPVSVGITDFSGKFILSGSKVISTIATFVTVFAHVCFELSRARES